MKNTKRVRAYLRGGLGNQCFIYATARALALRRGAELELDLGCFEDDKVYGRKFLLDRFRTVGKIAPMDTKPVRFAKAIRHKVMTRLKSNGIGNYNCDYHPYTYRPLPADWQGTLVLDGYWQSEKYYYAERDIIVEDFRLKDDSPLRNDPDLQRMKGCACPVFIHMRSYKEVPGNTGAVPVGDVFYDKSISLMRERLGDKITLFLFSDDLVWAEARMANITAVNGLEVVPVSPVSNIDMSADIREFSLMQECHHGIVANSSFSRFAAWLGEQRNLAAGRNPIYVHNSKKKNGYCPERWTRIDDE